MEYYYYLIESVAYRGDCAWFGFSNTPTFPSSPFLYATVLNANSYEMFFFRSATILFRFPSRWLEVELFFGKAAIFSATFAAKNSQVKLNSTLLQKTTDILKPRTSTDAHNAMFVHLHDIIYCWYSIVNVQLIIDELSDIMLLPQNFSLSCHFQTHMTLSYVEHRWRCLGECSSCCSIQWMLISKNDQKAPYTHFNRSPFDLCTYDAHMMHLVLKIADWTFCYK